MIIQSCSPRRARCCHCRSTRTCNVLDLARAEDEAEISCMLLGIPFGGAGKLQKNSETLIKHCTKPLTQVATCTSFLGAGCQCWSSRVCPDFVLSPDFIQLMSSLCPEYVLALYLTNSYPQNPRFVLIKSRICPCGLAFVLFLSSDLSKIARKIGRQNLVKNWT